MADVLSVVGDRWALLVVREVALGRRRFEAIQVATGAPRAVLSDRLRRLADAGILHTEPYRIPGSRERRQYGMTESGLDLLPVLAALSDWGERHLSSGELPEIAYRHSRCGGQLRATLLCECGQQIDPRNRLIAQVNR